MDGDVTEDQAISHAQYLDMVYSQFGTLYDLIPQASLPRTDPAKTPTENPIDGVVSSIKPSLTTKPAKKTNDSTIARLTPTGSTEVNSIQIS